MTSAQPTACNTFANSPVKSKLASANHNQTVRLITNTYKFNLQNQNIVVYMYDIKTEPQLPDDSRVLNKLTRKMRDQIRAVLPVYMPITNKIYSTTKALDDIANDAVEEDGQTYKVTISQVASFRQGDKDLTNFLCKMFKMMIKKVKFEQIGRNMFNPARAVPV
jgi:hypothetical protein